MPVCFAHSCALLAAMRPSTDAPPPRRTGTVTRLKELLKEFVSPPIELVARWMKGGPISVSESSFGELAGAWRNAYKRPGPRRDAVTAVRDTTVPVQLRVSNQALTTWYTTPPSGVATANSQRAGRNLRGGLA